MSATVTVYNESTGEILRVTRMSNAANAPLQARPEMGEAWLLGEADPKRQFVKDGELVDKPVSVIEAIEADQKRDAVRAAVNAERDRRINGGIPFLSTVFQFDPESRENIHGAASAATIALVAGNAQKKDYFWHGGKEPFTFIDKNNNTIQMDAPTMIKFGQQAAAWKSLHIFAARALKEMDELPENFRNDHYWPKETDLNA